MSLNRRNLFELIFKATACLLWFQLVHLTATRSRPGFNTDEKQYRCETGTWSSDPIWIGIPKRKPINWRFYIKVWYPVFIFETRNASNVIFWLLTGDCTLIKFLYQYFGDIFLTKMDVSQEQPKNLESWKKGCFQILAY